MLHVLQRRIGGRARRYVQGGGAAHPLTSGRCPDATDVNPKPASLEADGEEVTVRCKDSPVDAGNGTSAASGTGGWERPSVRTFSVPDGNTSMVGSTRYLSEIPDCSIPCCAWTTTNISVGVRSHRVAAPCYAPREVTS